VQLDVTAGPAITLTGLDDAPQLQVTAGQTLTLNIAADQGPAGPPGGQITATAGATLNGHRAVAYGSDGRLVHADAGELDHVFAFAGVITEAAVEGESLAVHGPGEAIEFSGWSWSAGPVWYGVTGQLTQTQPAGYPRVIGRGDGSRLFLDFQPPVEVI
jgi:hypothetical protein